MSAAVSLPTYQGVPYTPHDPKDPDWERDFLNHTLMFGSPCVVSKRGRGWWVEFRGRSVRALDRLALGLRRRGESWISATHCRIRGLDT